MAKFTQALFNKICREIAKGKSLREVCKPKGMPTTSTVHKWLVEKKGLSEQYARAREDQADFYADEIIEIADEATAEDAVIARLKIDARKWKVSKMAPKKYGDRAQMELSAPEGSGLVVNIQK